MALINKKKNQKSKKEISPNLLKILQSVLDDHLAGKNAMQRFTNKLKTYLDKKVDKKELVKSIYGVDATGQQHQFSFDSEATGSTIMWRGTDGRSRVESPLADKDIANKKYVDEHGGRPDKFLATIDKDEETGIATITDESGNKTEVGGGGGGVSKEYVDEQDAKKVDKLNQANKVYATNGAGGDTSRDMSSTAAPNSIPIRNGQGNFKVSSPQEEQDVANKKYVDEHDGNIQTLLLTIDEEIEYDQPFYKKFQTSSLITEEEYNSLYRKYNIFLILNNPRLESTKKCGLPTYISSGSSTPLNPSTVQWRWILVLSRPAGDIFSRDTSVSIGFPSSFEDSTITIEQHIYELSS